VDQALQLEVNQVLQREVDQLLQLVETLHRGGNPSGPSNDQGGSGDGPNEFSKTFDREAGEGTRDGFVK
jgi:hypothetical protein